MLYFTSMVKIFVFMGDLSIEIEQYLYTENGSKNRSGKLSERSVANKCVPIVSMYEQVGERCHVYLLDMYISKRRQRSWIIFIYDHWNTYLVTHPHHGSMLHQWESTSLEVW